MHARPRGADGLRPGRRASGVVARDRLRHHQTQTDPVIDPKGGTAAPGQHQRE